MFLVWQTSSTLITAMMHECSLAQVLPISKTGLFGLR